MKLNQKDGKYYKETGEFFGEFFSFSIGPKGESTGEFKKCRTCRPFAELGVTHINGQKTSIWE